MPFSGAVGVCLYPGFRALQETHSIYDRDGNFDIELYVIRTTRKSKVPLKIEDPDVLRMVERLLPKPKGAKPNKGPRKVRQIQLPPAPEPVAPPAPVEQRLQNLEGQISKILTLLEDKAK
jgi:hypothetical protein